MVGFESLSQQRRSKVLMCPQPTKKMQGFDVPSANKEDARFACALSQQRRCKIWMFSQPTKG
jgi:hypothetical protein